MTCLHGLDMINCPVCRTARAAIPSTSFKIKEVSRNELKPYFHKPNDKEMNIKEIIPNRMQNRIPLNPGMMSMVPEMNSLNKLPDFKNKMFNERLNEIDITKKDIFKIAEKIPLESPDLKLEDKV